MSVAFIFPGQGTQSPGMLHHLLDHPAAIRTLNEVSEALHFDVRNLDREQCLERTDAVQLAMFAIGVATARALVAEGVQPVAVAGLSIGAFAAAVTADVLQLRDGVELVSLRANEMANLYPTGYGLSAIVGLTESQVGAIVHSVTSEQNQVFVGNINAPRQIIVAGSNLAMDRVLVEALRQGARRAVRLHISVPSHCPLLQPVADLLGRRISAMNLNTPRMTYVGNVNARAMRTKEQVAYDLVNSIAHGVRWHDATAVLQELGASLFLEMPPGHTLSDLANENLSGVNSVPVEAAVLPRVLRLAQQSAANT